MAEMKIEKQRYDKLFLTERRAKRSVGEKINLQRNKMTYSDDFQIFNLLL